MSRTHKGIIGEPKEGLGAAVIAGKLFPHMPAGRWTTPSKLANTVQAWRRGNSIPGEYWGVFERAGVATVAELLKAAEDQRLFNANEAA
jgi:hypothetical protein